MNRPLRESHQRMKTASAPPRPAPPPPGQRRRPAPGRSRTLLTAIRVTGSTSHAPPPPSSRRWPRSSVPRGTARRGVRRGRKPAAAITEYLKEYGHGRRHDAGAAGKRRPLRSPDPSLEPEDEALHLHRAQRHLHHRPAPVAVVHRPRLRVRQGDRRPRRLHHVRGYEEAGPGGHRRAGDARRHAVRQPALARRHAHQLLHRLQAPPAPEGAGAHRLRGRGRLRPHQEGAPGPLAREGQAGEDPRWYPRDAEGAQRRLDRRHQEGAHRRR